MANELEQQIIKQIEYYFGDINLHRDKFLQEKIKEDEGWVTLEVLLTFKRLSTLSTDPDVIAKAVQKSENKMVEVSEDSKKIRRNPEKPIPELNNERRQELMGRTAYAKGFPLDEDFNKIISFLDRYGPIESCNRRGTPDHKFKGSCFIIFKDIETCKKFVELESVKYGETELIRKFQKVYIDEKRAAAEEMKKAKKEKKEKKPSINAKPEKQIELPKGAVIYFDGLEDGQNLTREELKDKVKEVADMETQFIEFTKGDIKGYLRFPEDNDATTFFNKLSDGTLEVSGFKLKLRVLEGEEEEQYLKKSSDAIHELRKRQKHGAKFNRKRKGNFGQGGRETKSRKSE